MIRHWGISYLLEDQLVNVHVLCNQGIVVQELLKSGAIPDESLLNEWWEVMEWWLVTSWLAEQLQSFNEVIIEDLGCYWWGRQASGQAIYLDKVICDICSA